MTGPPEQFIVDEVSGQQLTTVEYRCWMEGWAAAVEWLEGPCPHLNSYLKGWQFQRRHCPTCWDEFRQGVKP